jgi:hypothetical protein
MLAASQANDDHTIQASPQSTALHQCEVERRSNFFVQQKSSNSQLRVVTRSGRSSPRFFVRPEQKSMKIDSIVIARDNMSNNCVHSQNRLTDHNTQHEEKCQ